MHTENLIVEALNQAAKALGALLNADVLFVRAAMQTGLDEQIRKAVEKLAAQDGRPQHLAVMLETSGGSVEVVERISDVFRHHYNSVSFVIPNFAYSAGTVLALSGDDIYMNYFSVLGPIDPQILNRDGRWVPGAGYLGKYYELVQKNQTGPITLAELEFLTRKFDPAELFAIEQATRHSADLIEEWLCIYKFKDWTVRESDGGPVTPEYKRARAKEIARLMGDATEWNSHGRGIPKKVLESDKLKLKIKDFGANPEINTAVRRYYDLMIDYCGRIGSEGVVHTNQDFFNLGG